MHYNIEGWVWNLALTRTLVASVALCCYIYFRRLAKAICLYTYLKLALALCYYTYLSQISSDNLLVALLWIGSCNLLKYLLRICLALCYYSYLSQISSGFLLLYIFIADQLRQSVSIFIED